MKRDKEKEWDALLLPMMKEAGLEEPSLHFTEKVLSNIEKMDAVTKKTPYSPVFSLKSWIIVAMVAVVPIVLSLNATFKLTLFTSYSDHAREALARTWHNGQSTVVFSNTVVYAALILVFYVFVQIYWLKKNWSHKRVAI